MTRISSCGFGSLMVLLSHFATAGAAGVPNGIGSQAQSCYRLASRDASPIGAALPACGNGDGSRTVAAAESYSEDESLSVQPAGTGDGDSGWLPPVRQVRLSDVFELYSSVSFFEVPALRAPSMLLQRVDIGALRRRGIRSLGDYLHMEVPAYEVLGAFAQRYGGGGGGYRWACVGSSPRFPASRPWFCATGCQSTP